jgi:hypothetical protein
VNGYLAWSGLGDLWDQHDLDNKYEFITDVLGHCSSAWIDRETGDAGFPGRSGVWHTVSTRDPAKLKEEIKEVILELAGREDE